jgi:hypothetical protein
MTLKASGGPWYEDLVEIFQALEIVVNNGPGRVGGGGKPRQPPLPPLCGAGAGAGAAGTSAGGSDVGAGAGTSSMR